MKNPNLGNPNCRNPKNCKNRRCKIPNNAQSYRKP